MTALLQHLLSGWSRLLVEQASKGFAEQRRQDLQARWQRTRSVVRRDGCNRLAVAHLGRRPSRPVDRAKVLGGAAVDCSSRRRARRRCPVDARRGARVRAARHRCRCVRARPPKPQIHQRHSPNGASSARRHGAGWDLGRRDEYTPACPNGQAKYYSSKLIQPEPTPDSLPGDGRQHEIWLRCILRTTFASFFSTHSFTFFDLFMAAVGPPPAKRPDGPPRRHSTFRRRSGDAAYAQQT